MIKKLYLKKLFIIALCVFSNIYSSETDKEGTLEIVNKTDKDLSYNIHLPALNLLKTGTISKKDVMTLLLPIVKAKKANETYVFYLEDFDEDAPTQHFYIKDPNKTVKITLKTELGQEHICLS